MMEFTTEEVRMLLDDGYFAAFMGDIREGDLVAIPPVMRTSLFASESHPPTVQTFEVQRLIDHRSTEMDDEGNVSSHRVMVFIGIDLEGLPRHKSYGATYNCFIKREGEVK